jgi:hypothetical protein
MARMSPGAAEYTVSRTYLDWLTELPWAITSEGSPGRERGRAHPRRGPLRPGEGQAAHPRVPRGAQAQAGHEGPDPVPRRPAGRRQDLARQVRRPRARPQDGAHQPRRRARRGRDPRPPAHLHRLDAGQDREGPEEGRHHATPCSCSTRSTSSAPTTAATRRARCWRCSIPSRTTRSPTTTSTCRSTCRRCCSSPPRTCPTPSPARCATAWRSSGSPGTRTRRRSRSPGATCGRSASRTTASPKRSCALPDATLDKVIENYTLEAGVRSLKRELAAVCRWCAREVASGKRRPGGFEVTAELLEEIRGPIHFWKEVAERTSSPGRGHRARVDRDGRRDPVHRGHQDEGQGRAHAHRLAGRRDEGVGVRGAQLHPLDGDDLGIDLDEAFKSSRPARPRAVRRDPQGRAVGRRHDGHGAHVPAHRAARSIRPWR